MNRASSDDDGGDADAIGPIVEKKKVQGQILFELAEILRQSTHHRRDEGRREESSRRQGAAGWADGEGCACCVAVLDFVPVGSLNSQLETPARSSL